MGYNALIGTSMALIFGGVLAYTLKTGEVPLAPSHFARHTTPRLYWIVVLLCGLLLALSVKVALTPIRRDERTGRLALHRTAIAAAGVQEEKRSADEKAQRQREAIDSTQREEVDRRYAEIAGIWSDDAKCASDPGSQLRISADGLDFGHSHFHVEAVELKGDTLLLQGHYITHRGIKDDVLTVIVIDHSPIRIKIFDKLYFICSY